MTFRYLARHDTGTLRLMLSAATRTTAPKSVLQRVLVDALRAELAKREEPVR